jgi:hypothetical protein
MSVGPDESQIFFAYPSRPEISRDALASAAAKLDRVGGVRARTWEDLQTTGKVIIDRVTQAIDSAALSVFDITTLNENVLFELGYAIGSNARLWLVRDTTRRDAEQRWREVGILVPVGYEPYANSDDIVGPLLEHRPDLTEKPFFDEAIAPTLEPAGTPSLFFVRGLHDTDPAREVDRRLQQEERRGVRLVVADSRESTVEPLTWYAFHCHSAVAVLVHFASPRRVGGEIHNARCALIAGLARGMKRPLLMLAESEYDPPLDYHDLLYRYESSRDCLDRTNAWLSRVMAPAYQDLERRSTEVERQRVSSELRNLRLGEPVAENERDRLGAYFVETAEYRAALEPRTSVFVGRKGTGKSANFFRAAAELSADRRQVVCVVRPTTYDLDGLLRILRRFDERDSQNYLIESLWKYLLYTEVALAVQDDFVRRPAPIEPGSPEWALNQFLEGGADQDFHPDFAIRLERLVGRLADVDCSTSLEADRRSIAERLHAGILHELRGLIGNALGDKRKVTILIDNLDQSWDSTADLKQLSQLLLGLLATVDRITTEFARAMPHAVVELHLGVFLRSDIYRRVVVEAREPDKIPIRRLTWDDPHALLNVIERRYAAGQEPGTPGSDIWSRFFTHPVRGAPAKDYIVNLVLPRPRDIVSLCNAAIDASARRGHGTIEEDDLLEAERVYSQNAFEALLVELQSDGDSLGDALYEFAGTRGVLSAREVRDALDRGGIESTACDAAIDQLVELSFLGVETSPDAFTFLGDDYDRRRLSALATNVARKEGRPARYQIHPAFRTYLQVAEDDPSQQTLRLV